MSRELQFRPPLAWDCLLGYLRLRAIPGVEFREMLMADACCGSAGIYNALHTDMSMRILDRKMGNVNQADAQIVATANPGCMLQLRAGA